MFSGKENEVHEANDRLGEKARQNHQDITYIQLKGAVYCLDNLDPKPVLEFIKTNVFKPSA